MPSLPAQSLKVIKNINTTPVSPVVGSLPSIGKARGSFAEGFKFSKLGGRMVFPAETFARGRELFAFDGRKISLVKDIRSGTPGSGSGDFFVKGGKLYFVADDGVHGKEPWISDGTTTGTRLFMDVVSGGTGSNA